MSQQHYQQSDPAAYIVTDNRGKRYLVFSGSVEHKNAVMFGYKIKPLYELGINGIARVRRPSKIAQRYG